ncbi:uncharacterized protein ARMOST_04262 [Armillaria ostoyae]|uniref:Uncharacterized protein n=1 Tax=Armillaria ostoyae TaxID=47428 RepID=A0A284QWV2_ARMOS|nr:uncharacterized protein ARMOST_04262 [Armillaria ostoyae]
MKTAHRQMKGDIGCAGNGKSLRVVAFIGTHVSVARSYPHDSLLRVKYGQCVFPTGILATNGTASASLSVDAIDPPAEETKAKPLDGAALWSIRHINDAAYKTWKNIRTLVNSLLRLKPSGCAFAQVDVSFHRFTVKAGHSFAVTASLKLQWSYPKYLIPRSSVWSATSPTVLYIPDDKSRACRVSS